MSEASNRTFTNEQRYRERRMRDTYTNPGFYGILPDPNMDALWGSLEGQKVTGLGNSSMGPMASLQRAAKPREPEFDATEYQAGRAALDRDLNDNFARKWSQRGALEETDRAQNPMTADFDAQLARDKAAKDAEAKDAIAADSFARMEPTRRVKQREDVQFGRESVDIDPRVVVAREATLRGDNANQSKQDVEIIRQYGKTTQAGIAATARLAASLGMNPSISAEEVLNHVDRANQNIGIEPPPPTVPADPNIPARVQPPKPVDSLLNRGRQGLATMPTGTRSFPMDRYDELVQEKGSEQAADDWLKLNNWSKPIR